MMSRLHENHWNQQPSAYLFVYSFVCECACAVTKKEPNKKRGRKKENNQPLYTLICVIAQIVYDVCLCRVCRTRVFFCCDNESTVSQHHSLPSHSSSKMENKMIERKSEHRQTRTAKQSGKKNLDKQTENKRDFPTASMQTEWWIAGTRAEKMLKTPKLAKNSHMYQKVSSNGSATAKAMMTAT